VVATEVVPTLSAAGVDADNRRIAYVRDEKTDVQPDLHPATSTAHEHVVRPDQDEPRRHLLVGGLIAFRARSTNGTKCT